MIPSNIRQYHALHQDRPYPCGYCFNFNNKLITSDMIKGRANVICEEFINSNEDGDAPMNRCDGGLTRPTGLGDCDKFVPIALEIRTECQDYILRTIESPYMMMVLSRIYAHPGITRKEVIRRSSAGYRTRPQRIDDLIMLRWVESDGDRLYCTAVGDEIAYAVSQLNDTIIREMSEGDLLEDDDMRKIFEYIMNNPRCKTKDIYDRFSVADIFLPRLQESDYVAGEFDSYDWNTIRYTVTERGMRAWQRTNQSDI